VSRLSGRGGVGGVKRLGHLWVLGRRPATQSLAPTLMAPSPAVAESCGAGQAAADSQVLELHLYLFVGAELQALVSLVNDLLRCRWTTAHRNANP
jgi:hypothetical protein